MTHAVIKVADDEAARRAVYEFRYRVYVGEMGLTRLAADHERRQMRDAEDKRGLVLYADVDGEVAGTIRVNFGADGGFPDEFVETYDLPRFRGVVGDDRMAVLTRYLVRSDQRGGPLALQLLVEAGRKQLERGVELSFCDCQPHLLNL